MIGRLSGIILEKQPPLLVIDANGVGYELSAPMPTFYQLPEIGEKTTLFTHLVVREDAQTLYGFHDSSARNLFRHLIKVSGVGPKLALTMLSGMEWPQLVSCIQQGNAAHLTSIPGIGKKTAERLIIETRDRLEKATDLSATTHPATQAAPAQPYDDALSALTALGYKPNDSKRILNELHEPQHSREELIRLALRQMAALKE